MSIIESLIQPPGSIILLIILCFFIIGRFKWLGRIILLITALLLYFFSTKVGVWAMHNTMLGKPMQSIDTKDITNNRHTAIVILGAGRYYNAQEYGDDTLSGGALIRLRYGAKLAQITNLPILVSGGKEPNIGARAKTEAELMADALENEYGVKARWLENLSRNTYENAKYSAEILKNAGVKHAIVVTHGYHIKRSLKAFKHFGINVIAAPTRIINEPYFTAMNAWLPKASELEKTTTIIHEWFGQKYYQYRYNVPST